MVERRVDLVWCGMQAIKAGIAARHRPGTKEGAGDG
jgi:hypothetical protein